MYNKKCYVSNYYLLLEKYKKGRVMKKVLYVVSTYYHALISCVKQLLNHDEAEIICLHYIPDGKALSERIRLSGLFEKTFYVDKVEEYKAKNVIDYVFRLHKKNAKVIERQISIELDKYDEINIFHDDTWFAHYLKDRKIKYRLVEDAFDTFKSISKSNFAYMISCAPVKLAIKRLLSIGYVYCGYDKCTTEVEVNDINGLEINRLAQGKLTAIPRKAMFESLTEVHTAVLKGIFLKDIPPINENDSVLLLTQPFFVDHVLDKEEKQVELYKKTLKKGYTGARLVIKPHPRDHLDYSVIFPDAICLDKNMPIEILGMVQKAEFLQIITVSSTAINFLKAKKYVIMKDLLEE